MQMFSETPQITKDAPSSSFSKLFLIVSKAITEYQEAMRKKNHDSPYVGRESGTEYGNFPLIIPLNKDGKLTKPIPQKSLAGKDLLAQRSIDNNRQLNKLYKYLLRICSSEITIGIYTTALSLSSLQKKKYLLLRHYSLIQ